nr:ATPase, T2SS/T4P/T4SS family [Massilia sp. MB5]
MTITLAELARIGRRSGTAWLKELSAALDLPRPAALLAAASLLAYEVLAEESLGALTPDFDSVSFADMSERLVLICGDGGGRRLAVLGQPFDDNLGLWLARLQPAQVFLADPEALRAKLDSHESNFSAVADAVGEEAEGEMVRDASGDLTLSSIQGEASPAVKLINSTVFDALRLEASDIHLESQPQGAVIKFRIDGVLNRIASVNNPALAEQAIARIKVLAELDIGEKRIPQDGRFRVASKGRDIDIRVSIMPSIHGEDAVLRVLDKKALIDSVQRLTLDSLGFDAATIQLLRRLAAEPYGMMLVTGPTGSGKTTTLYAALTEINQGEDKFITIEDPVEYQLPGVLQIPVNEKRD